MIGTTILWILIQRIVNAGDRVASEIRNAECVVLFEGLPHQGWERELLEKELRTMQTVQFHGFPFYSQPLPLTKVDAKRLTDLYCDPKTFHPWRGQKKCGGFHPDYCIEWHVGEQVYQCLLCFGCDEAKVFGPGVELYYDINRSPFEELKLVLKPYRKNRPLSGHFDTVMQLRGTEVRVHGGERRVRGTVGRS